MINKDSSLKYKLFAIDLDNTLLNKFKRISKLDICALKKFAQDGGQIFVTTGKSLGKTLKYIRLIEEGTGIKLKYCSCLSGNMIYDLQNKKVLYQAKIEARSCERILKLCSRYQAAYLAYIGHSKKDTVFHLHSYRHYQAVDSYKICIIASFISIFRMQYLLTELNAIPDIEILTVHSYFYEIVKAGSNKGSSLIFIAKLLNIDLAHVACAGDSHNDLTMFKVTKNSFLVRKQSKRFNESVAHIIKKRTSKIAAIINQYFYAVD